MAFKSAMVGAFIGKVVAAFFIAVCLALGFGPDKWAGFIVSGMPLITPTMARIVFGLLALLVFALFFGPMIIGRMRRPPLVAGTPTDPIPLTRLRELAIEAGWESHANSVSVGLNNFFDFAKRLRQAGVSGDIQFSGRKYEGDLRGDTDTTPFLPIPKAHFEEFEFDVLELAEEPDNHNIFTGKFAHDRNAFRGRIYRDICADEAQSIEWLSRAGKPPKGAKFRLTHKTGKARVGSYEAAYTLTITNCTKAELKRCSVQLEQMTGFRPDGMSWPLILRTEEQILSGGKGRWRLSPSQPKSVPVFFRDIVRKNEWFFFDENGMRHHKPARAVRMVLGVYSAKESAKILVDIALGTNWEPEMPSMSTVSDDYELDGV